MSHLLAFHLGPVQDFIATARRTQDWWIGSWILAHLSHTALQSVSQSGGAPVLPPSLPDNQSEVANTPNHFFARFASEEEAVAGANAAQQAVRDEWTRIGQQVKSIFLADVPDELWRRQMENFLEVYWVVVADVPPGSAQARQHAQEALDARKRLRNFAYVEEPSEKCGLCGVRQELSRKDKNQDISDWWKAHLTGRKGQKLRVRETGTERLCAVCVVKRAALAAGALPLQQEEGSFPSTSGVAAAGFKRALLTTGRGQAALEAHIQKIRQIGIQAKVKQDCLPGLATMAGSSPLPQPTAENLLTLDGDLFFVETFTEERLKKDFPGSNAARAKEGTDSLRALFKALREEDSKNPIPPPCRYYAALKMDGDRMGAFFGQAGDPDAQDLSKRLGSFATGQARQIVEKRLGRLVYAGGDDAFALVPLEEALACARELQEGFKQAIANVDVPQGTERPTPSIGIALAHNFAALDGVLLAMQRAEKDAKNVYDRNALCIHVLKRSGEEIRVGTKWSYAPVWAGDAVALLERVIQAFRDETLSMKFAGSLAQEARGLSNVQTLPLAARVAAIRRLAKRHSPNEEAKRREALRIGEALAAWAEALTPSRTERGDLEEVARWIQVARFIVGGGDEE